jgi:restriction endonuclease Mrr
MPPVLIRAVRRAVISARERRPYFHRPAGPDRRTFPEKFLVTPGISRHSGARASRVISRRAVIRKKTVRPTNSVTMDSTVALAFTSARVLRHPEIASAYSEYSMINGYPEALIQCIWCGSIMAREPLELDYNTKNILHLCEFCRYWEVRAQFDQATGNGERRRYSAIGMARDYEVAGIDPAVGILRDELTRHPERLTSPSPRLFEHLVADVLHDAWGPCEVRLVGGSGDGGTDLILVMGDHTEWFVQVKRREDADSKEGCRVVRELNGTLLREGKTKGLVVTTASSFTQSAFDETRIKTVCASGDRYEIELVSGPDFISMMQNYPRLVVDPYSFHDIYTKGSQLHG